ncbi:hypothetical protein SISSUDRAFT_1058551 [Sistotremastrum suecicum HHB10207 ss-3]|uniref:Uncharacterized protein n=1 Tax=Sistotremastrum suecicum HHB10207 ss-3 TaxID=1314776 RepID=A0A166H954_9AGAM|nr:hypothetical protein SISSUDRAFT_1058551 [Sistotremastrum suecicum HHB10207 ss-3]
MALTTTTGLLAGLGLRILLDRAHSLNDDQQIGHLLLVGTWQGALLYHVLVASPPFAPGLLFGLGGRLMVDIFVLRDMINSATTLLGVALGILLAGVCAQLWNESQQSWSDEDRHLRRSLRKRQKFREQMVNPVPLAVIPEEESDLSSLAKAQHSRSRYAGHTAEISALRAQANAAAGDCRRFQEERKWAISQGNFPRASQLAWQIKKYEALRDSFEREARRKARESSLPSRNFPPPSYPSKTPSQRRERDVYDLHSNVPLPTITVEEATEASSVKSPPPPPPPRPASAPPAPPSPDVTITSKVPAQVRITAFQDFIASRSAHQPVQRSTQQFTQLPRVEPRTVPITSPERPPSAPPPTVHKDADIYRRRTVSTTASAAPRTLADSDTHTHHFGHGPGYGLLNYLQDKGIPAAPSHGFTSIGA